MMRVFCYFGWMSTVTLGSGCQSDDCLQLCTDISRRVNLCQASWNTDWQYLDASTATAFEEVCQNSWSQQTIDMEWRERVEAEEECQAVSTQLVNGEIECVDLQLLYFYDPQ